MSYKPLKRLKEPSTWVAIGGFLASLGLLTNVPMESWEQVGVGIAAVVSIVGAVLREAGSDDDEDEVSEDE